MKLECQICKNNEVNRNKLSFVCLKHYQENSSTNSNLILIDNESDSRELKNVQDFLNLKGYEKIKEFLNNYIKSFEENDYLEDNYINKIEELKNRIISYIGQNKELILKEDKEILNYKIEAEKKKKEILKDIKLNFQKNKENITSWIEFKSVQIQEGKPFFTFDNCRKIESVKVIKLFNIYKMDNDSKLVIKEKEPLKIWPEYNFENYFENENGEDIFIEKENLKKILHLKNKKVIYFNGCYSFDSKNGTLILTKDEEIIQRYRVYKFNKKNIKEKDLLFQLNDKIIKITIIPYLYDNFKQYSLFYSKENIYLIDIDTGELLVEFNINEIYNNYNFDDFQFLIYEKFFIIIHFDETDESNNNWDCDIFNICPQDKTNKFKKIENNIKFKAPKDCKFSISSIKNEIIIYYQYKEGNQYYFAGNDIFSSLSSVKIDSSKKKKKSHDLDFNEGNCI